MGFLKRLKKDKRGFMVLIALMIGVTLFILGMALAPALKDTTDEARNSTLLNCSTTDNAQLKSVCTAIDIQQLYFGIILGIAGIVLYRMVT